MTYNGWRHMNLFESRRPVEEENNNFKDWKARKHPLIESMNELNAARLTRGLSEEDYLRGAIESIQKTPAHSDEASRVKQECLNAFQAMLANITEPGGDMTEELGQQTEAWLKNPTISRDS